LFLLEGVAVYLDLPVLRALLGGLRQVAADGSSLAISLSVSTGSAQQAARRAAFQAAVAAMGEPARLTLETDNAQDLLASTGWQILPYAHPDQPGRLDPSDPDDRRRRAGFILAAPT
jgi:O-methyltransferase involved in polyketide biosynthesis